MPFYSLAATAALALLMIWWIAPLYASGLVIVGVFFLPANAIFPMASLLALVAVLRCLGRGPAAWQLTSFSLVALAVGAISVASVVNGLPGEAAAQLQRYIGVAAMVALAVAVNDPRILRFLGAAGAIFAAWIVAAHVVGRDWTDNPFLRDKNAVAALLAMSVPIFLIEMRVSRTSRVMAGACAVCLTLAIILTGSRGGMLAVITAFAVLAIWRQRAMIAVGVTTALIGALAVLNASTILPTAEDQSAEIRRRLWSIAVEGIGDHPIAGVGAGAVPQYILEHFEPKALIASQVAKVGHVHNTALQLALENGVAVALVVLALMLVVAVRAVRVPVLHAHDWYVVAAGAGVIAFLAQGTVDSFTRGYTVPAILGVLLGIAAGAYSPRSRSTSHEALAAHHNSRNQHASEGGAPSSASSVRMLGMSMTPRDHEWSGKWRWASQVAAPSVEAWHSGAQRTEPVSRQEDLPAIRRRPSPPEQAMKQVESVSQVGGFGRTPSGQALIQGGGRLAALALNLVSIGIVIAGLSPAGYGAVTISAAVAYGLGVAAAFGTDTVLFRALSHEPHRGDILWAVLRFRLLSTALAVFVVVAVGMLWVTSSDLGACLLATIPGILGGLFVASHQVLRSRVRLVPFAVADVLGSCLTLALLLILLQGGLLPWEAVLATSLANFLVWGCLAVASVRVLRPSRRCDGAKWQDVVHEGRAIVAGEALVIAYYRTDVLLLGGLASTAAAGLYGAVYKFVDVAMYAQSIVVGAFFPQLARAWRQHTDVADAFRKPAHILISLGLVLGTSGVAVIPWILERLSDGAYGDPLGVIVLLMSTLPILYMNRLAVQGLLAGGHGRDQLLAISAGFVGTAAAVVLIPNFGAEGAALATLISELAVLATASALLLRRGIRYPGGGALWLGAAGFGAALLAAWSGNEAAFAVFGVVAISAGLATLARSLVAETPRGPGRSPSGRGEP